MRRRQVQRGRTPQRLGRNHHHRKGGLQRIPWMHSGRCWETSTAWKNPIPTPMCPISMDCSRMLKRCRLVTGHMLSGRPVRDRRCPGYRRDQPRHRRQSDATPRISPHSAPDVPQTFGPRHLMTPRLFPSVDLCLIKQPICCSLLLTIHLSLPLLELLNPFPTACLPGHSSTP